MRPVNIGGSDEVTVRKIAEKVVELTGSRSTLVFVDRPVDDPERRKPDTTLARELLGWEPVVGWEEGLKRTIAHYAGPPGGAPAPFAGRRGD